jgi:stage II sporulation protein E
MQHQDSVGRASLQDRLKNLGGSLRAPLLQLGSGLVGFLLSSLLTPWAVSPFGAAWVSAQDGTLVAAALGSMLGYILSPDPGITMRSVAAVALILGLRWVLGATSGRWTPLALSPLIAAGALGATHLALMLSSGMRPYALAAAVAEMILAAGGSFFLLRSRILISQWVEQKRLPMRRTDAICLGVSGCLVAMALMQVEVGGFSPGRVAAVLTILMAGYYGGAGAAAVGGVVLGLAAALSGSPALLASYAVGGLCAAVFAAAGRLMAVLAFTLVCGVVGLTTEQGSQLTLALFEAAVGSAVFLLLPPGMSFITPLKAVMRGGDTALSTQLSGVRMQRASEALTEISALVDEVADRLAALAGDDIEQAHAAVAEQVCRGCKRSPGCWQAGYSDTMAAFSEAGSRIRRGESLSPGQLPQTLRRVCLHPDQMADSLSRHLGDYVGREGTRREAGRIRSAVGDQFSGMAMLLNDIQQEMAGIRPGSRTLTAAAEQYFSGLAVEPLTLLCYEDADGRPLIDVTMPGYKLGRVDLAQAALALSDLCEERMGLPEITHIGDRVQLVFAPVAEYLPTFHSVQRAAEGSRLCGDHFVSWADRLGSANMVLSDGMGAGGAAAVDSTLTTTLMARLIGAGARFDAALRLVNSALLVKSSEESLATIDACAVDLYTGKATFYKAGAAPSFVLRSGKVMVVETASLPAGILRGVRFERSTLTLGAGDRVVMVSDGVTATGSGWIPSEMGACRDLSDEALCEHLIATAEARLAGGRQDDMTVAVMTLNRG